MLIIITYAAGLRPQGICVKSAADIAKRLEALFGSYAKIIFSLGLCAAAFSSLMVNGVIGGGLFSDGFGKGRSMNAKMSNMFTVATLILGMLVVEFYRVYIKLAPIWAQASLILAVPCKEGGMYFIYV